ncbi:MAG: ACP S-malonyltransferase [Candidatus Cloacimonadota bacterium]|nr:ACP S-malonyltransferase [Candidatus Cloacimonadota bacterium]
MKKSNVAFVFPGQGAQEVGMAKEFYSIPKYKKYFELANEKLNFDLKSIMFEGPIEELKQTYNTQPAILLHSILALKLFQERSDIEPAYVAGHSLGEFSALCAANTFDWLDALLLVHKRGKFMVDASRGIPYKMAAILGLDKEKIVESCESVSGNVVAANFNTPSQTVISGEEDAVNEAMEICKKAGAKRVVPLVVGGAFHSPLIKKSSEWLFAEMKKVNFKQADIPTIANYTAKAEIQPDEIKENLRQQIISPVRWVESVEYMINKGVDTFIEFGPGKVVSGMIKKIDRNVKRLNISSFDDLDKTIAQLNQ